MRKPVEGHRVVIHRGMVSILLDSLDVGLLEFRDRTGNAVAAFTSFVVPGSWVFSCCTDPGWAQIMESSGYTVDALNRQANKVPGRLRVFSRSGALVLDTPYASVIELWRNNSILSAVFNKYFNDDTWIFANEHDSDWESSKKRLGYGVF